MNAASHARRKRKMEENDDQQDLEYDYADYVDQDEL